MCVCVCVVYTVAKAFIIALFLLFSSVLFFRPYPMLAILCLSLFCSVLFSPLNLVFPSSFSLVARGEISS